MSHRLRWLFRFLRENIPPATRPWIGDPTERNHNQNKDFGRETRSSSVSEERVVHGMQRGNRLAQVGLILAALVFLLPLGAIAWRVYRNYQPPGPFDPARQGFCDFHNGVYYPAQAVRDQVSPFGQKYAEEYPISRPMPLHAPYLFALHVPYTWLEVPQADVLHYLCMSLQLLLISWLSWVVARGGANGMMVLGLAGVLAASRAGYGTLFTGYMTLELVLGAILALHFADRSWWGTFGFVLCAAKPTYGIPLALLLLARGNWRTVLWGGLVAGLLSALVLVWLLGDSSLSQFQAEIAAAQEKHRADLNEIPQFNWTRVDFLAVVAKWLRWEPNDWEHLLWMLPLIALPCGALWSSRSTREEGLADPAGLLSSVALISTLYHHYYDLLVLVPAVLAMVLAASPEWWRVPVWQRWLAALAAFFVLFNYLSAQFILARLNPPQWIVDIVTSLNGLLLLLLLAWSTWWTWRTARPEYDPR